MIDIQTYFETYVKLYVERLTEEHDEFFVSLSDIDETLLENFSLKGEGQCHIEVVNHGDYSSAVRLRNDVSIKQIVLLSGEGVKHFDSLKDFNEYSIFADNKKILWDCLECVFQFQLSEDIRGFLEIILEQNEVSFEEFLRYLAECIMKNSISVVKLNRNLYMLGIWRSNSREILKKGKLRRMIRTSKYEIVESRLTKAIMSGKIDSADEKIITNSLAKGDVQKILEKLDYERMQDFLKIQSKGTGKESSEEISQMEVSYSCSYEYKLLEKINLDISEIERKWLEDRNQQDKEPELDWSSFCEVGIEKSAWIDQLNGIYEEVQELNLLPDKIQTIAKRLEQFREIVEKSLGDVQRVTPICLESFCNAAEGYAQEYFSILSEMLADDKIRCAVSGTDVIQNFQMLFCEVRDDRVIMPYYHPICVFYYLCLRRMYQEVCDTGKEGGIHHLINLTQAALIKKIGMQFPIDFISCHEKRYGIDFTTVGCVGKVEFTSIEAGMVYSVLDFRIIHNQIVNYLLNHPYLTEITVALVDLNDLGGLILLENKIRQISQTDKCNIGRVNFLILSSKEEVLKKQLSQMWDTIGTDDIIRFRFGRRNFLCEKGYDIERIVAEADMIIFADSSVLYQAPRMIKISEQKNIIENSLTNFQISEQIERYFQRGKSYISVLWDTLQHVVYDREEGFWQWKSREIDNGMLAFINRTVEQNKDKTIVALSSNKNILSNIFRVRYMQAQRRKYNGKSITIINFDAGNERKKLSMSGKQVITHSLKDFYSSALELENIQKNISDDIIDIDLEIYYENDQFNCNYNVYKEWDERDMEWKNVCDDWLKWQIREFQQNNNIISCYFSELWLNQWYEGARSLTAVLMLEKLCSSIGLVLPIHYKKKEAEKYSPVIVREEDCMEAVKIHEIIMFAQNKAVIDERTVNEFSEHYEKEMLERILENNRIFPMFDGKEIELLQEIYNEIKEL